MNPNADRLPRFRAIAKAVLYQDARIAAGDAVKRPSGEGL